MFTELAILRLCQHDGWDGVWVDTFGKAYRRGYWQQKDSIELPAPHHTLLQRIYAEAGSTKGCWDVVCWKDDHMLFAEAKRHAQDRMRDTQRTWLEAALNVSVPISSFLTVEWTVQTRRSDDGEQITGGDRFQRRGTSPFFIRFLDLYDSCSSWAASQLKRSPAIRPLPLLARACYSIP